MDILTSTNCPISSEEQTSLSSLGGAHMFLRLQGMALTRERNQDTTPIGQKKNEDTASKGDEVDT
ncbi:unnamed protein product [Camellia sinensis]